MLTRREFRKYCKDAWDAIQNVSPQKITETKVLKRHLARAGVECAVYAQLSEHGFEWDVPDVEAIDAALREAQQRAADEIEAKRRAELEFAFEHYFELFRYGVLGVTQTGKVEFLLGTQAYDPHRFMVEDAIDRGESVPPEIAIEYPDLAAEITHDDRERDWMDTLQGMLYRHAIDHPLDSEGATAMIGLALRQRSVDEMVAAIPSFFDFEKDIRKLVVKSATRVLLQHFMEFTKGVEHEIDTA